MKRSKAITGWLVLIFLTNSMAQIGVDTVKQLRLSEIVVKANRIQNFSTGTKIIGIDSTYLSRYPSENLADVLGQSNLLFAKMNGPGGLATTSIRGMDAAHTVLLWNGFNINSPMNNSVDLTLVPVGVANDVKLQLGGAGALWGSGAIGGAIHLNNKPVFNQGITAQMANTIGSYGRYVQSFSAGYSTSNFVFTTRYYWSKADNDYLFLSPQVGKEVRQTNSRTWQHGLTSEAHYQISQKWMINIRYWYQWNDRLIPSTVFAINRTYQKDESHRISNEWQYSGNKFQLALRNGLFLDQIIFGHDLGLYYYPNRSLMHVAELEGTVPLNEANTINIGVNNTYAVATAKTLPDFPSQNRLSLFASHKFSAFHNRLRSVISGRELVYDGKFTPFTPSLGIEWDMLPTLITIRSSVARVYRVPTLNDFFWNDRNDQGNPTLLPELGWSTDAGLSIQSRSIAGSGFNASASVAYFYNDLTNRILWRQSQNGLLTPINIDEVEAQGVEFNSKLSYKSGQYFTELLLAIDYTSSIVKKTAVVSELGKQLQYVPFNKGSGGITLGYKRLALNYLLSYTGFRYTDTDNSTYLDAFAISNVTLTYAVSLYKGVSINTFAKINNITDEYYEVLATTPMPPRNYSLGVVINFNKPNKSKTNTQ